MSRLRVNQQNHLSRKPSHPHVVQKRAPRNSEPSWMTHTPVEQKFTARSTAHLKHDTDLNYRPPRHVGGYRPPRHVGGFEPAGMSKYDYDTFVALQKHDKFKEYLDQEKLNELKKAEKDEKDISRKEFKSLFPRPDGKSLSSTKAIQLFKVFSAERKKIKEKGEEKKEEKKDEDGGEEKEDEDDEEEEEGGEEDGDKPKEGGEEEKETEKEEKPARLTIEQRRELVRQKKAAKAAKNKKE